MDFSKYKKVKEDKNSTTMQSDKGHTITLMHSTMPRIQVEQLKRLKMGDGGRVGLHIPEVKKMADGGETGDSTDTSSDTSTDTAQPATNITINAAPAPGAAPAPSDAPQAPPSGVPPTAAQPVPYQASSALPATAAQYAGHSAQFQNPEMKPAESNTAPNGTMDPGAVMRNTTVIGNNQQALVTKGAQANAVAHASMLQALSENAAQQTNAYNDVARHTDDYAAYIRNHPIDAQNYVKSMPGGEKVATALGLLLGGFTQGFHGGNNPAADWLNQRISDDIDAQKSNQSGQKSILGAYQSLYGNNVAATAAARASIIDMYSHQANQIALQLGTPQAAVNNQKFQQAATIARSKELQDAAVNLNWLPGQGGATRGQPQGIQHQGGSGGGGSGAPGGHPAVQGAQGSSSYILAPDAQNKLNVLAWRARHDPSAAAQLPAAQQQYESATQAEKALQEIDKIFPLAAKNTTAAGSIANAIEDTVGQVPFGIGKVLGNLPGEAIRDLGGQKEKLNKSYSTQLEGYISAALAGTGATPTDKGEMAREYKPLESDSPEVQKAKLEGLKQKIITLQKTSALGASGMLKK